MTRVMGQTDYDNDEFLPAKRRTAEQVGVLRDQKIAGLKNFMPLVLQIIRMSTEDGPGIRTTVFFKGCTLNCAWCHNPESISPEPQVCWVSARCIGCLSCLPACMENALSLSDAGICIDRNRCTGCGACAEACPGTALELLGTPWEIDALVDEVAKDRAYFDASGGGVTVSGGEPTMQSKPVALFLKKLRETGIHTALDTCGQCRRSALEDILPYSSMVLFDLKFIDAARHRKYTGHDNRLILSNIEFTAGRMENRDYPAELWIRTPIIPGATDSPENIAGIGRFISENLFGVVSRWELCAFNNLCRDKYERLGRRWEFAGTGLLAEDKMSELTETARKSGVDPEIVCRSGATRSTSDGDHREKISV